MPKALPQPPKATEKVKAGRPAVPIDADNLRKLARLLCTHEEIAAFFECSERTIIRKLQDNVELAEAYERGKAEGRMSLRRLQWRHAQGAGSSAVQMTIHMSKHHLGETERAALDVTAKLDVTNSTPRERVTKKLDALRKRIDSQISGLAASAGARRVAASAQ